MFGIALVRLRRFLWLALTDNANYDGIEEPFFKVVQMPGIKKLAVVENTGPNTLLSYLKRHIEPDSHVDAGVAFITKAAIEDVLPLLKRAARNGHVRILTGLQQCFTEPGALRLLLKAQAATKNQLSVRLARSQHFHWKVYLLSGKQSSKGVVGSSNLTSNGLTQNGEYNVALELPRFSKQFLRLERVFVKHWKSAATLSAQIIENYEKHREKHPPLKARRVPLSKILGNADAKKDRDVSLPKSAFWRERITGFASKQTQAIVARETDWDRNGWLWANNWDTRINKGDQVVVFDHTGSGRLYLVDVKESTPLETEDGEEHFVAYRHNTKVPSRRLNRKRWSSLRKERLLQQKDDSYQSRKLQGPQFQRLVDHMIVG